MTIHNEEQYKRTGEWAERFADHAGEMMAAGPQGGIDPILYEAGIQSMLSLAAELRQQQLNYMNRKLRGKIMLLAWYVVCIVVGAYAGIHWLLPILESGMK